MVAAFESGWTSATQLLGIYGSAARGEGVYLAGNSLGKLLRTIYLCDHFTLPDFRQAIYEVLERGESVHALQRAIHIGTIPVRRGRDLEEIGVVSGSPVSTEADISAAESVLGKLDAAHLLPGARMNNGSLASLAFLTITSLLLCRPSLSAGSALDSPATEAAARKADADWAAAARTPSVDSWMPFYAADAIVLLPNDEFASGAEFVRHAVSRLLALPQLSVAWRPIESKVAQSGDLAFLIDAYELRFHDPHDVPVSDRGRRLEIWRKQADGSWKCIVDTWNLDAPFAPPPAAPPGSAQGASPTAGSAARLTQAEPPPAVAALESGPPAPARGAATKYGDIPANYEEAIRGYFLEHLKHPESVQYREITQPDQGYTTAVTGGLLMREKREYGWTVKATINAKNSRGSYVGFKTYTFLFRGEMIVDARLPLPGDEMN